MPELFLYGTLRHLPLLAVVLGRDARQIEAAPAELAGYDLRAVEGEVFPMLVPAPSGRVRGIVLRGLGEADLDRLRFYEGGFGYAQQPVRLRVDGTEVAASAFLPRAQASARLRPAGPWRLAEWVERWGAMELRAAEEAMAWHGRLPADEVARRMGPIRRRAWAWLAARARSPARDAGRRVEVLEHRRAWLNFFGMEEARLRFLRHDGTMSAPVERAALMVGDAVVVLPYDPARDCVLLTEQFRAPVFLCGDPDPWTWEPVAGLIDAGEVPEDAARREAMEEAGLELARLEPAGRVYSSTGSSGEFLHLFVGIADLSAPRRAGGGVAAEGEDIRTRILGYDALMRGVDECRYRDMPLVTVALWLARHRDRLRKRA